MNVSSVKYNSFSFKASEKSKPEENPVSSLGEKATLTKAAFISGAGLGAKFLFELIDDGFVIDKMSDKAKKIASKQKNLSPNKRLIKQAGIFTGLSMMFIGGFAALYTLFKAPEINYNGNINAFKKSKDMDIYIKSNSVEKELYTQMNEKAKTADEEEKAKLRTQYMQMKAAKNQIPSFVE